LNDLQERYDVQFNYVSELVDSIRIIPTEKSNTLEEAVSLLSDQTNLNFAFLSKKIISIKKKSLRLCGYLKDINFADAVPYVTIQFGKKGTITNEEGYFEIEGLQPDDIISIQHIGYKTLRRQVQFFETSECDIIYLVSQQEQLAEVTVYDYLVRGIDKFDNGTLELDFDRFSILPGLVEDDVLQSVQALPGIQSVDETVSNINIRGGSHDQNFISWDGIKMYQSGHFFGLISMYNPLITRKVVLRKNGSSVTDTDGVSGSILMKTDEYLNDGLKGSIGVNLIDANGAIDTNIGQKASLQVAARKSVSNFVETTTYSKYFERIAQFTEIERNNGTVTNSDIAFGFYDASFRFLYRPSDDDRLRVNFIHTANEVTFNENAELNGAEEIRESNLAQSTIAAGVNYQKKWTDAFQTEIEVYNTDYKLKAVNANILENQRFLQENKVSETGAKLVTKSTVSPQFSWINGYHFIETKVTNLDDVDDPVFIRLAGEVLRTHSLFTEVGVASKGSGTRLNLGIRFNYLDDFNKQLWEPRLSFNQTFWKYFNIEILGEFKHQSTSQVINFQNDFLGIEKRRWQLSNNQDIPVITSKQISSGLSFNRNSWLLNAVPFYKKVEGITTQSQGLQGRYEFVKTSGSYTAYGLDFLLRKQLKNNSLWLSYSYLDSDYLFKNLPETQFSNVFGITHTFTFGSNYTLGNFLFAAGVNWRTGKPFTRPSPNNEVVNGEINYDKANNQRLDDYARVDISANYQFRWGEHTKIKTGISLWNLLDRRNPINTFFSTNTEGGAERFDQSSLGITPNASIRVIFD